MNWFVLFAVLVVLFAFAVIAIAVIAAKKQELQKNVEEFQMVHKGCGGDIEIVLDAEESDGFEGLVLKAVCKKCGAEQVLMKYGLEPVSAKKMGGGEG